MCVIVHKTPNVTIDKRDLWNMWNQNPDGAGFAYLGLKEDGSSGWFFEKGFMKFKHLRKRLKLFNDYELVLHFRHATHGLTNQEMCHPFVLKPADNEIHNELTGQGDVLFHNGVMGKFGDKIISDTFEFATGILAKIDVEQQKKLLETVTSKFILCYSNTMFVSGYFSDFKGLKVSNTNFDHIKTVSTQTTGFDYPKWHHRTYVEPHVKPTLVSHSVGGMLPYAYANEYEDYHYLYEDEDDEKTITAVNDANKTHEQRKAEEDKMWKEFRERNRYWRVDEC